MKRKTQGKIALTLLAFAVYAVGFFVIHPWVGFTTIAFSMLPVLLTAWWFGTRGGLFAALLAFPLNTLLVNLAGELGWDVLLRHGGGPDSLMLILAGGIVGWLSDTRRALRRQMAERKQAEEARQQQLQRLQALYQMTAILNEAVAVEAVYEVALDSLQRTLAADRASILLFDPDGVMRFKAWRGLSETYRKAVEGHSPWSPDAQNPQPLFVPDAQAEPTLTALRRVFSDEGIGALAFIPLICQGRLMGKFMIYYNTPHAFHAEEIQLAQTIARQVAFTIARARAEAQMRLQAAALDSSANVILITDREGVIRYVNPAFTTLTGYTPAEALGQTPRLLKSGKYDQAFYKRLWDTILAGQVWRSEIVNRRKDGALFTVEQVITPVRGEGGAITHFIAIELDVTARKQRERELEAMAALSAALRTAETLDEMLPRLLDETLAIVRADAGALWLYDPASGELHQAVARGWFAQFNETPIKPGEGIAGNVFATGQAHLSRDFARDPQARDPVRPQIPPGWGGACLPIRSTTQVIGVLFVAVPLPRELTPPEVHLLSALAEFAGVAIQRARLLDETRRRADEFAALYETSAALSAEHDLSALLRTIFESAVALLKASGGGVYLYDPARDELELVAAKGVAPGVRLKMGEGLGGRVAQTRQSLRVEDYSTWEGRSPKYAAVPFCASVGVPMLYGGELIGVLVVSEIGAPERKFTEADERLLSLFAAQAAGAIRTARLLDETRRRARHAGLLNDITRAAVGAGDFPATLQTLADRLGELLNADGCFITLWDEAQQRTIPAAAYGPLRETYPAMRIEPGEVTMTESVLRAGHPLAVEDVFNTPWLSPRLAALFPTRSMLALPLVSGGEKLGAALIAFNQTHHFTPDEIALSEQAARQIALAVARARLLDETRRRAERLAAVHEIDRAISGNVDLAFTLNVLLEQATARLGVDAAAVLLYDPARLTLDYAAGRGFRTAALQHTHLHVGEGFAGRAILERRILYIPDLRVRRTDFLRSPLLAAEGFVAYYAAPLIAKDNIVGVLELFHRAPLPPPSPPPYGGEVEGGGNEWLAFLETLAGQAAIAVENAQLFTNLQRANLDLRLAYDATIEGWSRALELRDEETEGHTLRVTELTLRLARALGLREEQIVHMRRGALLHDIGKMGVPDRILKKPGPLTDEEWVIMRRHPQYAYDMLSSIAHLKPALDIPYCHHEKWDGTGYPRGLKGEAIPLAARLFAVADVWDALTSNRPYRPAWSKEKALEYIREQSGKHFDPQVVEVFLRKVYAEGNAFGDQSLRL